MKKLLYTTFFLFIAQVHYAQGDLCATAEPGNGTLAWIIPATPDVEDSVYIYVDVSQDPNCDILVGSMGPLYLWTWSPAQPDSKIGTWNNSGDDARLEQVDGNIWRIGMIPTEFYDVDPEDVYEKGFCFLVKKEDGGTGGDCSAAGGDFKTTDIHLDVPSPFALERKVYSFPDVANDDTLYTRLDDVFTLFYDNSIEEKPTMQNVEEVFAYIRITGDNGQTYNVSPLSQVGNNPDLELTNEGDGIFSFRMIPEEFLVDVLPAGVRPARFRFQLITWPLCGTDCAVDGDFFYTIGCE